MARTHGHGNPPWSQDEVILALDLYNQCRGKIPSSQDKRIEALSRLLQSLPYDGTKPRNARYRNPDGVLFKLLNLRAVATDQGLKNVSRTDKTVWKELGNHPGKVRKLANRIRLGVTLIKSIPEGDAEEDGDAFPEGRTLTRVHKSRERSRKLRVRLIASRKKHGPLACDLCRAQSKIGRPDYEDAEFEVHHIIPIAQSLKSSTSLKDVTLLCASCHRLVHRFISREGRWLDIQTMRKILRNEQRA